MRPIHGKDALICEMARILGLDLDKTSAFSIVARAGEVVKVEVSLNLQDEQAEEINRFFRLERVEAVPTYNGKKPWCLLLTGMPNSGKSTIAYELVQRRIRNAMIIDGDKHREMQFLGETLGFEKEDILRNNEHACKMARFAQDQGINVIISQIAPYVEQRKFLRDRLDNFFEVYCDCSYEGRAARPNFRHSEIVYEQGFSDMVVDTESFSVEECAGLILEKWMGVAE